MLGRCPRSSNQSFLLGAGRGVGRLIQLKFWLSIGMSNSLRLCSSPGPAGSVPGSCLRGSVLDDSAMLAIRYSWPLSSAGRASQRSVWKGQWIRAVGTIDLDLEIPGWGIMSAAGRQACVSLAHCLYFPSAVCTGALGSVFFFFFLLAFSSHTVTTGCGRQGTSAVLDVSVDLSK